MPAQDNAQWKTRAFLEFDPDFPDRFADAFYSELFSIMPAVEHMFENPEKQRRMFANMLAMIMQYRSNEDALSVSLQHLGAKHSEIGLTSMHLKAGRGIFVTAIQTVVSDVSSDELRFFADAYDGMVTAMSTHSLGD